jgi:signal transduction histidine kinase
MRVKSGHRELPGRFSGLRLSTRLGLTLTGILVLAAIAQLLVYLRTRDETLWEADALYQELAKAIEVAATQMGPEGWKDDRVLADYTKTLGAHGLRDIKVTDEQGRPFPDEAPAPPRKKGKSAGGPKDIQISGVIGEGPTNRELEIPLVVEGKLRGHIHIKYSLESMTGRLEDNFRRRIFALLGVFALGLAVVLVLMRNATQPLDALADGAARVADGHLDVTVPVDRDDEIGRLAATFNHMTERLRERQQLEVRLAAAEKRAEIGHLASGLAHEIKNPLNALSLGLDVLRRRHRPEGETAASEYATRIEALREEIGRLAALINNFLAFGRPLTMNAAPTDLVAIVENTLSDLAETTERAHVTIEKEIENGLPRVLADGSLIKSAVWNLVQNAVQSVERSGGRVRVAVVSESAPAGMRVVVTVEDDGAGIAPEDLPRIFEPYFSKKDGGLGLGLAMVKRIVEDHGGKVSAGNRTDGRTGARFRLDLPVPV